MREGRVGTRSRVGRGLYRSEGGSFSGGGGPGKTQGYSDFRMLVKSLLGCSSIASSLRTSVAIGAPSSSKG